MPYHKRETANLALAVSRTPVVCMKRESGVQRRRVWLVCGSRQKGRVWRNEARQTQLRVWCGEKRVFHGVPMFRGLGSRLDDFCACSTITAGCERTRGLMAHKQSGVEKGEGPDRPVQPTKALLLEALNESLGQEGDELEKCDKHSHSGPCSSDQERSWPDAGRSAPGFSCGPVEEAAFAGFRDGGTRGETFCSYGYIGQLEGAGAPELSLLKCSAQ